MKVLKSLIAGVAMIFACSLQAQVPDGITVGTPPPWGPVGYPDVRYYYIPDVEAYYDIHASQFICNIDGGWLHRNRLPSPYKNYDLYDGYKVVLTDYQGNVPYKFFDEHKEKYAKGYRGKEQKTIGGKPGNGNQGKMK
jgi:hypothetical protein